MNSSERNTLRKMAHGLKPIVMIGKQGLNDQVITFTDEALTDHELVKVKFIDFKAVKRELSIRLADATGSDLIAVIGNTAILFRQNRDPKMRKVNIKFQ